jgi:hypothetical protein
MSKRGDYFKRDTECKEIYMNKPIETPVPAILVNRESYDSLIAERDAALVQLQDLEITTGIWIQVAQLRRDENEQLKQQLQEAKEMLRKCSPYEQKIDKEIGLHYICCGCGRMGNGHLEGCAYLKMIGGE